MEMAPKSCCSCPHGSGQSVGHLLRANLMVVLVLVDIVIGHPQCTDFRPPFQPVQAAQHCTRYTSSGCCTGEQDAELQTRFTDLASRHHLDEGSTCWTQLKELQCLYCSPYAAHAYDVEESGERIDTPTGRVPGLCPGMCSELLGDCGQAVVNEFFGVERTALTDSEFCRRWTLNDTLYCYPNIKDIEDDFLSVARPNATRPSNGGSQPTGSLQSECLCVEVVAEQLINPLTLAVSRDGSARLFIGEQRGIVRILTKDRVLLEDPYLDLSATVGTHDGYGDERGLLGLEFHPNFKTNGLFYTYYSEYTSAGKHFSRISEWRQSATNRNEADHASERRLLSIEQPQSNHNGGQVTFGPDGYLYIFSGDGGGAGDKHGENGNAQNLTNLLGKVLRINVITDSADALYSIPRDNPFIGVPKARPEIYAYGLRNPWRCSFDRGNAKTGRGAGRLFCGDVGQKKREEIDLIVNGGNYGWRGLEGTHCYDRELCEAMRETAIPPIYEYRHSVGRSVTGGYVYRGCQWPNLEGKYIYGDYDSGKMYTLTEDEDTPTGWRNKEICLGTPSTCTNLVTGEMEPRILSFGEDEDGEVYILATRNHRSKPLGKVYRLVDPQRRADPSTCKSRTAAPPTIDLPTPPEPTTVPVTAAAAATSTEPVTNATAEMCLQCQQRRSAGWSFDEICSGRHTHYLKVELLYMDVTFATEGLLLVKVLDWFGPPPPGPAGDRRPSYTFMFMQGEAVVCNCPQLTVGETYFLLVRARDHTFKIDFLTISVPWDNTVTPQLITQLKTVKGQCPT